MGGLWTIFVLLLALTGIVGAVAAGWIDGESGAVGGVINGLLLLIGGKVKARNDKRAEAEAQAKKVAGLMVVFVVAALALGQLAACAPYTYSGATSVTTVEGHGAAGTHVQVSVDGQGVCTVTGEQSTLKTDAATAMRICAAHPQCTWRTAK